MLAKFFPIAFALAIAIGAFTELALTGTQKYTVAAAINDADTSIVTIQGVVKPISPNRYILSDTTGKCELQTCPPSFRKINLDLNERVTVTGVVIKTVDPLPGTLYQLAVQKIERRNKPEIVVRSGLGRPPWMVSVAH